MRRELFFLHLHFPRWSVLLPYLIAPQFTMSWHFSIIYITTLIKKVVSRRPVWQLTLLADKNESISYLGASVSIMQTGP
jgi:hypothetical protein